MCLILAVIAGVLGYLWVPNFTLPGNIAPNGSFKDYPIAVIGSLCSAGPGIDSIPVSKAILHPGYTGKHMYNVISSGYLLSLCLLPPHH